MSAIPAVVAAERVPGGEANRIVGVVDALKYFDANEGGFGFLRRTGHPVANSREHHVHFRSKDAPEPSRSRSSTATAARAPRVVVTGPGDSAKVDGSKRKGSWTKEKKSPRSSWGEAKEKKQIPALSLGGSRPGASSAGAARSSRAESEGVPAVTDDGAGGAAREGDDGFASLDEQPGFFNPLAAKEARQWAAGARV
ncbi:serine-type endopeptidase [Aureococcus anophagefferens]|nr:serine-type endopeptidase [Aureococcus anophagefferens]